MDGIGMGEDKKGLVEQQRRKAVKMALVLGAIAVAFYIGYFLTRL